MARKTTTPTAKTRATPTRTTTRSKATAGKTSSAGTTAGSARRKVAGAVKGVKKAVGDVLGISRARVPKDVPRATSDRAGRPKGVELTRAARPTVKRAGVVGGVRGRGR